MTYTAILLTTEGSHPPMALDQAFTVIAVAVAVLLGVGYLFYSDYRQVFWQVER